MEPSDQYAATVACEEAVRLIRELETQIADLCDALPFNPLALQDDATGLIALRSRLGVIDRWLDMSRKGEPMPEK